MTTPTRQGSNDYGQRARSVNIWELGLWSLGISALLASLTLFLMRHYDYKLYYGPYNITRIIVDDSFSYIGLIEKDEWSSHEHPSDAEVLENGEPLKGTQGSIHSDIRQIGLGRYSFWYKNVYFSTSDNSDPRTNGRKYEIRKPINISDNLVFVSLAVSIQILICAVIKSFYRRRQAVSPSLLKALRIVPILISAVIVLISFIVYDSRLFPEKTKLLWKRELMKSFQPEIGRAFILRRVPPEERHGQNFSAGIIKENDHELGPSNSIHDTIRQTGAGAYSIWKDTVYFSSSDGSDPRTNGRSYVLYTPPSRDLLTKALLLLASVSFTLLLVIPFFTYSHILSRGFSHHILTLFILLLQIYFILPYNIHSQLKTWSYINNFSDQIFNSNNFSNELACEDAIQTARRVEEIRRDLGGIIRSKALKDIFVKMTNGAVTDTDKHRLILKALQVRSIHSTTPSNYSNGIEIRDPLLLLELGNMWCGQSSRLAVDLFEAGGYKARLVQLGTHVVAEIFYGNNWHYFDADIFGNGEVVLNDDGTIPSVSELGKPELMRRLDALAAYQESFRFDCLFTMSELRYPSYYYFSDLAYRDQPERPGYYYKNTPPALADPLIFSYGWLSQRYDIDESIIQGSFPLRKLPTIPQIEELSVDSAGGNVYLRFRSLDTDGDLSRYHIFISERSRGWNYPQFAGRSELRKYMSQIDGSENRLELVYQLPPDELGHFVVKADSPFATIDLKGKKRVFITIMPSDLYGESIGRTLFPVSNELLIDLNQTGSISIP